MDWAYELFKRFKRGGLAGIPLVGGFLAEGFDLYCKSQEERGAPDINAIAGQLAALQHRCETGEAVIEGLMAMLAAGEVKEEFREPLAELVEAVNSADGLGKLPPRFRGALDKIEERFGSPEDFEAHYRSEFQRLHEKLDGLGDDHDELKRGQQEILTKFDDRSGERPPKREDRLCNLPPRNEAFTGRAEQLDELHAALESGGPVAILRDLRGLDKAAVRQVIKGLGGVGKTQLAVEYGHCHAGEYGIRWLIRAETQQQIKIDLAKLGVLIEPELASVAKVDQQVACTLQLLNSADSALLIYDNVERPGDIAGFYPTAAGHVLITSRYTDWQTIARPISLETFTEAEALEYLHRRGLTDGEDELKSLAARLGYLPLGLAMAAGYMLRQRVSAGEYLGEYESDRAVLTDSPLPQDYSQKGTLPAVFERSFTAVGEQEPLAMELLEGLAFLAPDDIPLFVLAWPEGRTLRRISPELAEALGAERRRRELVSVLVDYSLVSRADDTLSIHRLTQDVVRHRLRADQGLREHRVYVAIGLVNAQVVGDPARDIDQWPVLDALTPHVRALREAMADVPPGDCHSPWPHLLNEFGLYCWARAEYTEAKECFERAIEMGEATLGRDDPKVAIHLNNLGNVLRDLRDLEGAKACHERALNIYGAARGPGSPGVATIVNNLGLVLRAMGDWAGAKECFERALKIYEVAYGANHPNIAMVANNLGLTLGDMGDRPGAKVRHERAVRIGEATLGREHPEVALWVTNLGGALVEMGEVTEARPKLEQAAAVLSDKLGPEHPHTQRAVRWLARVRREMA